jgi:hypothetical protein
MRSVRGWRTEEDGGDRKRFRPQDAAGRRRRFPHIDYVNPLFSIGAMHDH